MSTDKIGLYLALSDELVSLAGRMLQRAAERLVIQPAPLTIRDRVLVGLFLKLHHSFLSLVDDARQLRSESFHHLKSMLEIYFYSKWVGAETTDDRAKLVLAKTYNERIKVFNNSPRTAAMGDIGLYCEALDQITKGMESEWDKFKNKHIKTLIDKDIGEPLTGWYNDLYRVACEPAHIGDLVEYMPVGKDLISLNPPTTSFLKTHVALDYGQQVYCDILRDAAEIYDLGFDQEISSLKERMDSARMMT